MSKPAKTAKTNHQTGWHKPIVNPTTNYAIDSHKAFCKRCIGYHGGNCPVTGRATTSKSCSL